MLYLGLEFIVVRSDKGLEAQSTPFNLSLQLHILSHGVEECILIDNTASAIAAEQFKDEAGDSFSGNGGHFAILIHSLKK